VESLFQTIEAFNPIYIYIAVFLIAFVENIFPPSPSDVVIVFGGSLVGIGKIDFIGTLAIATLGSTLGFMTMFKIGEWFGESILEKNKLNFLPMENVHKLEGWFRRYGYGIIIANRFLSGTRAIVSFFAGMAKMIFFKTTVLCFLSALVWNFLLVYGGSILGENWRAIGIYLSTYSQIITSIIVVVVIFFIVRWFYKRQKAA
jgi:membrane protein DedA with SNARE-associated domain